MSLEDVNRLAQGLPDNPETATPIRDALEDLGLTWDEWLVRGGILATLADEMCGLVGHKMSASAQGLTPRQARWCLKAIAYRVPPLLVEVKSVSPEVEYGASSIKTLLAVGYFGHWQPPTHRLPKH